MANATVANEADTSLDIGPLLEAKSSQTWQSVREHALPTSLHPDLRDLIDSDSPCESIIIGRGHTEFSLVAGQVQPRILYMRSMLHGLGCTDETQPFSLIGPGDQEVPSHPTLVRHLSSHALSVHGIAHELGHFATYLAYINRLLVNGNDPSSVRPAASETFRRNVLDKKHEYIEGIAEFTALHHLARQDLDHKTLAATLLGKTAANYHIQTGKNFPIDKGLVLLGLTDGFFIDIAEKTAEAVLAKQEEVTSHHGPWLENYLAYSVGLARVIEKLPSEEKVHSVADLINHPFSNSIVETEVDESIAY